jgi:hypothetical protein
LWPRSTSAAFPFSGLPVAVSIATFAALKTGVHIMATAPKGVTAARPKPKDEKKDGKNKGPVFASEFGSHGDMISAEWNEKIVASRQDASDPWQVLTDERGQYATRKSRIDSGMADPNRYADQPAREKQVKELTTA